MDEATMKSLKRADDPTALLAMADLFEEHGQDAKATHYRRLYAWWRTLVKEIPPIGELGAKVYRRHDRRSCTWDVPVPGESRWHLQMAHREKTVNVCLADGHRVYKLGATVRRRCLQKPGYLKDKAVELLNLVTVIGAILTPNWPPPARSSPGVCGCG